jgi:hypothetical protein
MSCSTSCKALATKHLDRLQSRLDSLAAQVGDIAEAEARQLAELQVEIVRSEFTFVAEVLSETRH